MGNQNNFFTSTINRYKTDQIVQCLKPEQIQKSAKERIFREMVRGQIDYEQYGSYFTDCKFLDNLIVAAENELNNNQTVASALGFFDLSFPGNRQVISNKIRYENLVLIYKTICEILYNVRMTGNIGSLTNLSIILAGVSKYI